MLLVPDPCCDLSIGAIDMLVGLGGPHAAVKDFLEVEIEVKLQILWFLLEPCVLLLLPGPALEDERIEAEDAHHFLHVLGRMCRTQRGTSGGGWGLYAVDGGGRGGGLDYERGVDGLRLDADIVFHLVVVVVFRIGR